MSKWHGAKTHKIVCQGVSIIQENGSAKVIFADDHKKIRLVHKQDVFQVKRCEGCQKLHNKTRNRTSKSPVKAYRRLIDYKNEAIETLDEFRAELEQEEITYLEKVVTEGTKAEVDLAVYEAEKTH